MVFIGYVIRSKANKFYDPDSGKVEISRDVIFDEGCDGYYVAYKPITLSCILFMFIEVKFIHWHSCVMFAMKFMSMCND